MSYENLDKFASLIESYQDADLDAIIAVTGPKGVGKSSCTIQVTRKVLEKRFQQNYFSPRKYIGYDNEDVLKKIHEVEEFSPLIADEAARFAMGEDWNKSENKEMKKLFAQMRTKHLAVFLNIPSFTWMDRKYREDMVSMWLWIPTRGHGVVFTPDTNPGVSDAWHFQDFKKLFRNRISMFTPVEKIIQKVRKHKCYNFDFVFPPVPQEIYEEYLKLRDKKAFEGDEKYSDQKQIGKAILANLYLHWPEFMKEIMESRFEKPNYKILANLCTDPRTRIKLVNSENTVKNWVKGYTSREQIIQEEGGVEDDTTEEDTEPESANNDEDRQLDE